MWPICSLRTYRAFSIENFKVVCSVTWPLNTSEAAGDIALIQTSLHLSCKCTYLALEQLDLHKKSSQVYIKTKSPPLSLAAIQRPGTRFSKAPATFRARKPFLVHL